MTGMSSPIVTLTTDFGLRDGYVAAMKGVILGIRPDTTIVDISHDVPPQDIPHGAFLLRAGGSRFPPYTVHVAVVDPGVGTRRRPLLLVTPTGRYVAPDNGILAYVLRDFSATGVTPDGPAGADTFMKPFQLRVPDSCSAYVLSREEFWFKPMSRTFHGRDVFAPVAAHLCAGVSPEAMGEPTKLVTCLDIPQAAQQGNVVHGRVLYVDRFGNLVTNVRESDLLDEGVRVEVQDRLIRGLSGSYSEGESLLAIVGSHGYLEISVRNGSAAGELDAEVGTPVRLVR